MPNSKHYLLGFWAAMVSPVILLQDGDGARARSVFGAVGGLELVGGFHGAG